MISVFLKEKNRIFGQFSKNLQLVEIFIGHKSSINRERLQPLLKLKYQYPRNVLELVVVNCQQPLLKYEYPRNVLELVVVNW
ncbi:hypothetical protein J6590_082427 [Homalodisca vitripennis]|nr:hypothetical protein J6590_082427 [Homalodisca vitripennis]